MLTSGALLQNRYRILQQIGGGGMGNVYLADDLRLPGHRCAIKEVSPSQLPPQDLDWAIQTLRQEAQILSTLHHPGLTAVTDFFDEAGNWYFVMDYVEGETLEERLQRAPDGRLALADTLAIMRQLCDVLGYLHGRTSPVVFRDLKPANVMLTSHGQVKLIDFGIARFFKSGQTRDTVNLGTPGYASPEQYGGKGQTDPRSDVYSLGVLLHQLLTGHDPTTTPFALPPARTLNAGVSHRLEAIIQQATHAYIEQRFQSVRELSQALFAPTQEIFRPRENAAHKKKQRQVAWLGVGVVIVLGVSGFFAWSIFGGGSSSTATPTLTPSLAATRTATPTRTATVTWTATTTRVPTSTPLLTDTPTATPTATFRPTQRPTSTPTNTFAPPTPEPPTSEPIVEPTRD